MRIEVIRPDGELKREVWTFDLVIDFGTSAIYLDNYSIWERPSKRRKFILCTWCRRLDSRGSDIKDPPLPADVEAEARKRYQDFIMTLPIRK